MFAPLPRREIGFVMALATEVSGFPRLRRERDRAATADEFRVRVAGIGAEHATAASRSLVKQGVRLLVSWGMAGGAAPWLAPGDILLPREVVTQARDWRIDAAWRERFERALEPCGVVVSGRLWCSQAPVASVAAKAVLAAQELAAVDMESAAVAAVAASAGLPFVAVKVICDAAHHEVPPAALQMIGSAGRLRWQGLAPVVRAGPRAWGQLLTLRSDFSQARCALRRAALAVSR